MSNGRGDPLDHAKNFYAANSKPSKTDTDAQLRHVVSHLLSKHRPGVIRPEKTRKDRKGRALGGPGSSSKEEQDKIGKKHNKKRKAANDAENRKTTVAQGLRHTMRSKANTKLLCEHRLSIKKYPILGNLAMRQAIEGNSLLRDLHRDYSAGTQRRGPALLDRTRSSRPESQPLWSCCIHRPKKPSCACTPGRHMHHHERSTGRIRCQTDGH
jgi:hypothetical protein